ncbi:MAG: ribbon-helix-helix domain-containing protein [Hyphomicrobiaceae bacterium]
MKKQQADRNGMFAKMAALAGRPQLPGSDSIAPPKVAHPPSRQGKKGLTIWLDPAVIRALKQLAAETDRTQESLVREALNQLFKDHGKPPIA